MADKKITDLNVLTGATANGSDELAIVDISVDETKSITRTEFFKNTPDITTSGTVDGRDVATDGTKLDTVETNADVTDTANVTAAGALMDSELASVAAVKATTGTFLTADQSKLGGIESLADVTDVTNVTAAGALMDSELASIASVKSLDQGVATTDSPTFAGATLTTADVNGGTIDDTVIGGTTPAAGNFTALTSTGIDDNAAATAITIDASGNVLVGKTSTSVAVDGFGLFSGGLAEITRDGNYPLRLNRKTDDGTILRVDKDGATVGSIGTSGGKLTVSSSSGVAMYIDSSNVATLGNDSFSAITSTNGTGVALQGSGTIWASRNDAGLVLNRLTSDGEVALFKKDGTTVGSIGTVSSDIYMCTPIAGHRGIRFASGYLGPTNENGSLIDNATDLGTAVYRFDDIFASNSAIQTSDRNEKQDIASLTPTEMLVAARLSTCFKNFKWKDSVAEKGAAARTHSGVIAQDVQDAFTAEGLDAGDYSMFTSATWWTHDVDVPAVEAVAEVVDEDGVVVTEAVEAVAAYTRTDTYDTEDEAPLGAVSKTRLGVRYPELLSFVAAYNEQRFTALEDRITALEA